MTELATPLLSHLEKSLRFAGGAVPVPIADAPAATIADASQAVARALRLTGTLTANRTLVLPHVAGGDWIVKNETTGGFAVTVRGPTGSGPSVANGETVHVADNGATFEKVGSPAPATRAPDIIYRFKKNGMDPPTLTVVSGSFTPDNIDSDSTFVKHGFPREIAGVHMTEMAGYQAKVVGINPAIELPNWVLNIVFPDESLNEDITVSVWLVP